MINAMVSQADQSLTLEQRRRCLNNSRPKRGEIWLVSFDPTIGAEIRKTPPAVIISSDALVTCRKLRWILGAVGAVDSVPDRFLDFNAVRNVHQQILLWRLFSNVCVRMYSAPAKS